MVPDAVMGRKLFAVLYWEIIQSDPPLGTSKEITEDTNCDFCWNMQNDTLFYTRLQTFASVDILKIINHVCTLIKDKLT